MSTFCIYIVGGVFMYYDRIVAYLEYRERGERIRGAGFVKLERNDDVCNFVLQISGLYPTDTFQRDVYLRAKGREVLLEKITLTGGKGKLEMQLQADSLGTTGIPYSLLDAIRIPFSREKDIYAKIREPIIAYEGEGMEKNIERKGGEQMEPSRDNLSMHSRERMLQKSIHYLEEEQPTGAEGEQATDPQVEEGRNQKDEQATDLQVEEDRNQKEEQATGLQIEESRKQKEEQIIVSETDLSRNPKEEPMTDIAGDSPKVSKEEQDINDQGELLRNQREERSGGLTASSQTLGEIFPRKSAIKEASCRREVREKMAFPMQESKWMQLSKIYPHIMPFQDEREFLTIGMGDFVVFSEKSYLLSGNSFLLHGYHNYHHLVLCREKEQEQSVYYVGVPGSFYEKEKQAAKMFGFESFEGSREPALTGDYGYYMRRIEL